MAIKNGNLTFQTRQQQEAEEAPWFRCTVTGRVYAQDTQQELEGITDYRMQERLSLVGYMIEQVVKPLKSAYPNITGETKDAAYPYVEQAAEAIERANAARIEFNLRHGRRVMPELTKEEVFRQAYDEHTRLEKERSQNPERTRLEASFERPFSLFFPERVNY